MKQEVSPVTLIASLIAVVLLIAAVGWWFFTPHTPNAADAKAYEAREKKFEHD